MALAALLGGCDDGASEYDVSGAQGICVRSADAEGELEFTVTLDACLSSSCDTLVESGCMVTETEVGTLQVEAWGTIESRGTTCTADCGSAIATCTFTPTQAETYTVVAGDRSVNYAFGDGPDEACDAPL